VFAENQNHFVIHQTAPYRAFLGELEIKSYPSFQEMVIRRTPIAKNWGGDNDYKRFSLGVVSNIETTKYKDAFGSDSSLIVESSKENAQKILDYLKGL
jgi:hypothetical protein